ncbi:MAG: hypothetical protein V1689_05485 [Pseudomonadota bacterium]
MTDTSQKKERPPESSRGPSFNFSGCSPEKMLEMMKVFCGGEKGAFNCQEMMKKMCDMGLFTPRCRGACPKAPE